MNNLIDSSVCRISRFLLLAMCFLVCPMAARAADSLAEISQRVGERQAAIEAAISGGMAKETPQGLLESTPSADQKSQELIQAENRDRRAAFAALAAKYKVNPTDIAAQFSKAAMRHSAPSSSPNGDGAPASPSVTPLDKTPAALPTPMGNASPPAGPPPAPVPATSPAQARKKSGTSIPLKVLTRPFSSILAEASDSAAVVQSNIPAFSVFYVYSQQPGWLQVGKTKNGGAFGWIREKDAILWKQNLVMEFTHPANRMPVMFFKNKDDLKRIALENAAARSGAAQSLLSQINSKNIPDPFPVEALEPQNRATDSRTKFYMLPITEFEEIQIDARDGRLLKVAGATKDRKNQSLAASVQPTATSAAAKSALLDVVFVMDCSSSMKPLVDGTMQAIKGLVSKLAADPDTDSAMNLGFWGYRDSAPDQDFAGSPVKNFTPSLQPARQFLQTLSGVQVSSNSAGDYPEDVFGGVKAAMTESRWRPNSIRVVILVGDASAHPAGHVKNSSKMGDSQLRALANGQNIYFASFYIERMSPLAAPDRQVAEPQFRKLAENKNGVVDFKLIQERGGMSSFSEAMEMLAAQLIPMVSQVHKGTFIPSAPTAAPVSGETPKEAGARMAKNMFSGAFVDWLARQKDTAVAPPGDVESWVVDRDLKDPVIRPMEVKVLLKKNELDSLAKVLDNIMTAGVRGQVTGQNLFEALQSAAASAVTSPDQIRNARNLAATGLLPDFLADLPYKSRLMIMEPATWNSMSVDSQNQILEQVQAKRKFYEETIKDSSLWQAFNTDDSEDEKVAAVPLEQLP